MADSRRCAGSDGNGGLRQDGDGEVFSIAALWDRSRAESGEEVLSCAIITMPANERLTEIHNAKQRITLILPPEAVDSWLTGTPEQASALLVPYPSELMRRRKHYSQRLAHDYRCRTRNLTASF